MADARPDPERAPGPLDDERQTLLEQVHGALDGVIFLLSVAWIGLVVVELVGDGLSPSLDAAVWAIWAIFVADFLLEFTIAPRKRAYLRSHWLTVVSLVLPAFRILRVFSALRFLRAARVVRSLGLLRLWRRSTAGWRPCARPRLAGGSGTSWRRPRSSWSSARRGWPISRRRVRCRRRGPATRTRPWPTTARPSGGPRTR